jgi:cation diffusion facilitator CzcD-associated flavoprotein CzcO
VPAECDVAIVGSGPYALSVAAQLRGRGVEHRIFGPPMKFWRDMPKGINLKSFAFATSVWVPEPKNTFPEWCRANGLEDFEPCTMASFAAYGMSIKDRFVPGLEDVRVTKVTSPSDGRFEVTLENGERVRARRVVCATGLSNLAVVPEALKSLPKDLVTHTFDLTDYSVFRGKSVAVIGGGASAVEAGALVHEAGGRAEILVRDDRAIFHGRLGAKRSLYHQIRYPNSVLGPGMRNRFLQEAPLAVHFLPEAYRVRLVRSYLGPASPWWIKHRVLGLVPISAQTTVVAAEATGSRARLTLRGAAGGARTLEVDHVIAGTGYDANVDRLPYLDESLLRRIQRVERAPVLSMNFESSVPGAYFVGLLASLSFGPLFRFVAGGRYAAPALARHLAGRRAKANGTAAAA